MIQNFFSNFLQEINHPSYSSDAYYLAHQQEFESPDPLPNPVLTLDGTSKVQSTYQALAGASLVLPAGVNYSLYTSYYRAKFISAVKSNNRYVIKRLSIQVNGNPVDVVLMGKRKNLANGRWILYSNPNNATIEEVLNWPEIDSRIKNLNANYIFFNYPGVGCSRGWANQPDVIAAYITLLTLLADKENGIGAKEIIGWGASIGGGVQGEALKEIFQSNKVEGKKHIETLKNLLFKNKVKCVFVKDQTFGEEIADVPKGVISEKLAGMPLTVQWLAQSIISPSAKKWISDAEWSLNIVDSSAQLPYPEVIIQNSPKELPQIKEDIVGDGMISSPVSLAYKLLAKKPAAKWPNKAFIGVKTEHTQTYTKEEEIRIAAAILKLLDSQ